MADDTPVPDRPVPRRPRTDEHQAQIVVQNRRREYLNRHPSYYNSIEHELANPVLYERLIKRHQTPAEREAEGKAKGYGRTLEADLVRGETKLADLRGAASANGPPPPPTTTSDVDEVWDQEASDKEHGLELWRQFVADRFIRGRDDEFDYGLVDGRDDLDDGERRDAEDQWFDDEEPSWTATSEHDARPQLSGETGVQDY
ncbi:hypothetical protein K4F52_006535 [Lecanicillium sp. MT-2017a]|nr:hypothetical protein K4F52_006535 [Lecanicillium sp. MT-2017a]